MGRNLIVTVYHDQIANYFGEFLTSFSCDPSSEFEVLIFDDSERGINLDLPKYNLDIQIIKLPRLSLLENRLWIFNYLKDKDCDYIHFCDGDDTFELNYLTDTVQCLKRVNIVVHDFNLMNASGSLIEKNCWSNRLGAEFFFDMNFIADKNIAGLGNTSINKKLLNQLSLQKSELVTIPDWFIFTQILIILEENALFVKQPTFNYRQHNNLGDIKNGSFSKLSKSIKHVVNHFQALTQIGIPIKNELELRLCDLSNNFTEELYSLYVNQRQKKHFFWWEEVFLTLSYYENRNTR